MADDPPVLPGQPGPVHRLTFDYDGDQLTLASDQIVTMIAPPSHPLDVETPSGFSVILRDARDRPLYRFTGTSPIRTDAEVFSDEPGESLHRVNVRQPRGSFTVLVPAVEGGVNVDLIGQTPNPHGQMAGPSRLGRFRVQSPGAAR